MRYCVSTVRVALYCGRGPNSDISAVSDLLFDPKGAAESQHAPKTTHNRELDHALHSGIFNQQPVTYTLLRISLRALLLKQSISVSTRSLLDRRICAILAESRVLHC